MRAKWPSPPLERRGSPNLTRSNGPHSLDAVSDTTQRGCTTKNRAAFPCGSQAPLGPTAGRCMEVLAKICSEVTL